MSSGMLSSLSGRRVPDLARGVAASTSSTCFRHGRQVAGQGDWFAGLVFGVLRLAAVDAWLFLGLFWNCHPARLTLDLLSVGSASLIEYSTEQNGGGGPLLLKSVSDSSSRPRPNDPANNGKFHRVTRPGNGVP